MIDDDDDEDENIHNYYEDRERGLAFHEAGHAVVARALGATVLSIDADFDPKTRHGSLRSSDFDDTIKNLAVCVAGCRAEYAFEVPQPRETKKGDFRLMRKMLSLFPEAERRRAARAEGYRLADETLQAHADAVRKIADELLARRKPDASPKVRIEGDELAVLLAGGS